ncbi:lariat debranching enzyme [Salpingoeca rosetta]|uniref:Lariat debranching enzyme n=1 Tax=Salpingoeca rosetta (strain ATCC 50818 / BSB-021) TaxID=946362 RepID=F2U9A7_SALR5|nr:lariat debranching enzyme [Salpingoeca rosetta]EGD73310.1 lariat debranching enzyme [Salpingoeca rosetta]|eukprot:XP_004994341.1 lariat debranching enzyme [Salpingoeca rosetta]
MLIAVEGCCHGELDNIYASLQDAERQTGQRVDLLLCCGDFQAVRNQADLSTMACPDKYKSMRTFYKYYKGEKKAPVLTIFIGGNHEASNHMWELPYGGWVAPNIYYLGFGGVVTVNGVRIGGLSGIFNHRHYHLGHSEMPPFTSGSQRSIYHVREFDVFQLKQLSRPVDVFLSHDWPSRIAHHGDTNALIRRKPFLKDEIYNETLAAHKQV